MTTISKKVNTINQHIDKVLENAPTKFKVSVNVNDADWQKIQELFAKERQWMTAQMQTHIREVNSMFADERKKVRERYKEYDGCYLGHYAQWFFWFDSLGNPIGWGSDNDSKVYVEYDAKNFSFSVGQYPGKLASGDNYIVKEALVYTKGGQQYVITLVFNIDIK